jgi:hypothetical protein
MKQKLELVWHLIHIQKVYGFNPKCEIFNASYILPPESPMQKIKHPIDNIFLYNKYPLKRGYNKMHRRMKITTAKQIKKHTRI